MTGFVAEEGVVDVTGLWAHSSTLAALTSHTWSFYWHPQGAVHQHSPGLLAPACAVLEECWSPGKLCLTTDTLGCGLTWPQPCLVTVNEPINGWMWSWPMQGLSGLHPCPCHDFAFYRSCPLAEPGHGLWAGLAQVLWGQDQSSDTLALLFCPLFVPLQRALKRNTIQFTQFSLK